MPTSGCIDLGVCGPCPMSAELLDVGMRSLCDPESVSGHFNASHHTQWPHRHQTAPSALHLPSPGLTSPSSIRVTDLSTQIPADAAPPRSPPEHPPVDTGPLDHCHQNQSATCGTRVPCMPWGDPPRVGAPAASRRGE